MTPSSHPHQSPCLPPPAWWLRGQGALGGHAQTIWTALYASAYPNPPPAYHRERWATPDADFIDIDWLHATAPTPRNRPLMVLFHGLEGSSQSNYALAMAHWCQQNGWAYAVPHFRSCSGIINRAPRLYHMGDFEEADWILKRMHDIHAGPIVAVGVSLGGNVLIRWALETGTQAAKTVSAIVGVCTPMDLNANAKQMDSGFCKWVYTDMFLRTMRQKTQYKIKQYPGLFDIQAALKAKTFAEFDNVITAPLHGFNGCVDYWTRCSISSRLGDIRIPALLINPLNDPFIPPHSLPASAPNSHLTFLRPPQGGHLGFASGRFPGTLQFLSKTIGDYFQTHLTAA